MSLISRLRPVVFHPWFLFFIKPSIALIIFLAISLPINLIINQVYWPPNEYLPFQLKSLVTILLLSGFYWFALILHRRIYFGELWYQTFINRMPPLNLHLHVGGWLIFVCLAHLYQDLDMYVSALFYTRNWTYPPGITDLILFGLVLPFIPPKKLIGRVIEGLNRYLRPLVSKVYLSLRLRWLHLKGLTWRQRLMASRFAILLLVLGIILKLAWPTLMPPQIVATYPNKNGEGITLDSQIEIQFDRPMLQFPLTDTISIDPPVPFDGVWENDSVIILTPKAPLNRQATYTVSFTKPVLSQAFIPQFNPGSVTFYTIGHPEISLAAPQDEASESEVTITVLFDRPMVPLKIQEDRDTLAPAFTISPQIEGEGRWLGTSSYQFRPSSPLPPATTYTYTVAAGLPSADGGILQQDAVFQFSTMRPRIESVVPREGYDFANPSASVAAILNLPLSRQASPDAIEVYEGDTGKRVEGIIRVVANRIGFIPRSPLKRDTAYRAIAKSGITSVHGPNGLENDYVWNFKTSPLPKVIDSKPQDKAADVTEMHRIYMTFNAPMDEASVKKNLSISPAPERDPSVYVYSYQEHEASIGTYLQRSTTYTVTLKGSATDIYNTPLGRDYSFTFTTGTFKPSLSIVPAGTYYASFNAAVAPRVIAKVTNTSSLSYTLYALTRDDFLHLYRLRHHYDHSDYNLSNWQKYDPSGLTVLKSWSETFDANPNVPVNVATIIEPEKGKLYPPGLYFLDVRLDNGVHDNLVMVVTNTALTLKQSEQDQYLVWAVNQSLAQPVPDMKVEFVNQHGKKLAEKNTNSDGVVILEETLLPKRSNDSVLVFGTKGDEVSVVQSRWSQGIERYQFNLASYYDPQESSDYYHSNDYKMHVTLDRPIYRPGHTVYYKGVIREDTGKAYRLLDGNQAVSVTINDYQGRDIESHSHQLSSYGTFSGSFVLDEAASLGHYTIKASHDSYSFNQSFQVEEYVLAAFETAVKSDKDKYINLDNAAITITGNYYFGAPITNAQLDWFLTTDDYYYQWYKDVGYEFGAADYYDYRPWWSYSNPDYHRGRMVTQGEGALNDKGEYQVKVPVSLGKSKTDQKMRVEAVVRNKDNQVIAGSKDVIVTASAIRIGIKPSSYSFNTGSEAKLEVISLDLEDAELPNIPVTVTAYKRNWISVKEFDDDSGGYYWSSKPEDIRVGSDITTTTNENGRASAGFTFEEGGMYRVVVVGYDAVGRASTAATYVWISGQDANPRYTNNDRILLIPDKADYQVNETASVQAVVPYESMLGLVTTERDSVYRYQLVNLTPDQRIFEINLDETDSPNIFVSALFIKPGTAVKDPPQMKMGLTEIRVKNPQKQLHITLEPDKPAYEPGDTATINVSVQNGAKQPVKTELAMAVVDQSVWALSGIKLADIFETFYRPKNHRVNTSNVLSISLDRINATIGLGSKGGSGGGCFSGDTLVSLADGSSKPINQIVAGDEVLTRKNESELTTATVNRVMIHDVDEYVRLALSDRTLTTTAVHRFYVAGKDFIPVEKIKPGDKVIDDRGKWHQVKSITTISQPLRVYNLEIDTAQTYLADGIWVHNEKGGGDFYRSNFQDTVFWNGHVETDNQGKAQVKVQLADNTTTWRVMAQGVTQDTAVGQSVMTVLASKNTVVRPLLPRFVSVGDSPALGFSIHNRLGQEVTITANITATNFSLDRTHQQTVTLPANSERNVVWTGTVTGNGDMTIGVTVKQQQTLLDSFQKTIPIHTYYTKEVVAVAGVVTDQAQETIHKPATVVPDRGTINYRFSPVMGLGTITDVVGYYDDYSHWCTEQTSSRIVSLAPLVSIGKTSSVFSKEEVATMDTIIKKALQRLVATQRINGGWSYWEGDNQPSNLHFSALAMEALYIAKSSGYTVDGKVEQNGLQYLKQELAMPQADYQLRAFVAKTISRYQPVNAGVLTQLMNRRWEMSAQGRADLLTALDNSKGQKTDRDRLYNELMSLSKKSHTTTHFEDRMVKGYLSNSTMLTASFLPSIAKRNNKHPMIPEILRYFDTAKRQGYWRSTRETAVVTEAIAGLIKDRGDLAGEYEWQLLVNQAKVNSGQFTSKEPGKQLTGSVPLSFLSQDANIFTLQKSGKGNLYYNLDYTYYLPYTEVPEREQGMVLIRELLDENGKRVALNNLAQGREYWVRLILAAPNEVHNVLIEDALPAGFEPVNESLATTAMGGVTTPALTGDDSRHLYITHQEMRDNQVVLYSRWIYPGVYEYTYRVHSSIPGKFHYPPAVAADMNVPEINGHSSGSWVVIK
jgi:uncharacterized protein YfaS (alpha-2-macroglobulin family)